MSNPPLHAGVMFLLLFLLLRRGVLLLLPSSFSIILSRSLKDATGGGKGKFVVGRGRKGIHPTFFAKTIEILFFSATLILRGPEIYISSRHMIGES